MENHKISKLLNDSTVSKFVTRKWIGMNDLSGGQYSVNKNTRFKIPLLRSNLCDYSDAYIAVKGTKDLLAPVANESDKVEKDVTFKNNTPFRSRINNLLIDNAEDLDIVMSMYNLLEYSNSYSMASKILWNYYRDGIDGVADNASQGKSFEYKTKIIGKTPERPPRAVEPPPNPDGSLPP